MSEFSLKYGVSTWLWKSPFTNADAEFYFQKIKSLGFDAIELPIEDPVDIDASFIKSLLKKHELSAVVCGAFSSGRDLASESPDLRENSLQYILDCVEIARGIGAKVFAGPMYSAVGKARMVDSEQRNEEWKRAVEGIQKAAEAAAKNNIILAVEPMNRFETDMVNTSEDVIRMVDDVNHENVKVVLDSFHMCIEEQNLEEAIIRVGEKLAHFQVSENHRGVPGTGLTDWKGIKRGLNRIDYKGIISIESFTPENKSLAEAVCIWKKFTANQDEFARSGLNFLKTL